MGHDHGHLHGGHNHGGQGDRRGLIAAFVVIVVFMVGEVVAGILAHSLALIADAGHMLTDAAALGLAVVAARIAQRPARGAYTYGFARVDALSGQANGITLVLLAVWVAVNAVRRLIHPSEVHGGLVTVVALVGACATLLATVLASRGDRASLNVRGVVAHLATDVAAFAATAVAGVVIVLTGWNRADPVASLIVVALMLWTGLGLIRDAGRIFLEAAPAGIDPLALGTELAAADGVAEVHDLHVWQIGSGAVALSAHVLVSPPCDCHEVGSRLRDLLADKYGIGHVTLQADHADDPTHDAANCVDAHGEVHAAPAARGVAG